MDPQVFQTVALAFGMLMSLVGGAGLWWVNTIWSKVSAQEGKQQALELRLAERYITRTELERTLQILNGSIEKLFAKLDEIKDDIHSDRETRIHRT